MAAIQLSGNLVVAVGYIAVGLLGWLCFVVHAFDLQTIEEAKDTMGRVKIIVY